MLQLIKRCPEYAEGYKSYCQEAYDHNIVFFRPSNPKYLTDDWFMSTKDWYDRKEKGLVEGQPVSFHYWVVDDGRFIGEFQLRTEFPPKVMLDIGSIGYAVRVSEWNKGYGTQILRRGLEIAKEHGMEKVLLNINEKTRRPFISAKRWAESFGIPLRGITKQKAIILSDVTGSCCKQ